MTINKIYLCETTSVITSFCQVQIYELTRMLLSNHKCFLFYDKASTELVFICEAAVLSLKKDTLKSLLLMNLKKMFNRNIFKKNPAYCSPRHINISNSIKSDKRKHLQGKIYLAYCRGNDCIMLIFYFKGFYIQRVCLLSRNYYYQLKKMGCFSLKEPRFKIFNQTPPSENFDYLRPE